MEAKSMILGIVIGIFIVVGLSYLIPSTQAVEIIECGEDDAFLCITLRTHLPQFEVDILNGIEGVLEVTELQDDGIDTTIIEIDPEIIQLTREQLIQYFNAIEINTQMNKANSVIRLDAQPSPICSRNVITGEMTGRYDLGAIPYDVKNDVGDVIGTVTLNIEFPVVNDSRFPI